MGYRRCTFYVRGAQLTLGEVAGPVTGNSEYDGRFLRTPRLKVEARFRFTWLVLTSEQSAESSTDADLERSCIETEGLEVDSMPKKEANGILGIPSRPIGSGRE